ncbi:MAG: hypothetical protein I3J02_01410 [Prevotella sp.]|nr:hypothetical protein [Prevotella sp.]
MNSDYDDIIDLPHHVSRVHPQMPMANRAAQFAPFAALTGHEAALREAARVTERQIQLDADGAEMLSRKLVLLSEKLHEQPTVTITYFRPDDRKEGGGYVKTTGVVRKVREQEQLVELLTIDGIRSVEFRYIVDLESELFQSL